MPPPKPCGTYAAYMRHIRAKEDPCDDCRVAYAAYRDGGVKTPSHGNVLPCGTVAAYNRHRHHGQHPCDDCSAANAAYQRASRDARRGGPPREPLPCGTMGAYRRHIRAGEWACDACREAARIYAVEQQRAYRARKKQQAAPQDAPPTQDAVPVRPLREPFLGPRVVRSGHPDSDEP